MKGLRTPTSASFTMVEAPAWQHPGWPMDTQHGVDSPLGWSPLPSLAQEGSAFNVPFVLTQQPPTILQHSQPYMSHSAVFRYPQPNLAPTSNTRVPSSSLLMISMDDMTPIPGDDRLGKRRRTIQEGSAFDGNPCTTSGHSRLSTMSRHGSPSKLEDVETISRTRSESVPNLAGLTTVDNDLRQRQ